VYDFTLPSDFERMYEDYFPKVYNFIFYRLLHKQDTEDLVSEVFLKVARNIFSFNAQKASFNTWIFTIARNTLTDYFRRRKNTLSLDECEFAFTGADYAEQYDMIEDDDRKAVYQALMRLDGRSRQVLALKYFGELSNREISKLTGINESTVSTIALRGRQKMREYLLESVN
jgi:RNA polymerase sigma-70 factor (ECF subfamily)